MTVNDFDLDDLLLPGLDDDVPARALLPILNRILRRAQRAPDLRFARVIGSDPGPPKTLAIQYLAGGTDNARYVAHPVAFTPVTDDLVVVLVDNNRAVVIGRLA